MSQTTEIKPAMDVGQARKIVADLFEPKAYLYWSDFLGSMTVGLFCFYWVRRVGPEYWWLSIICFLISGFAFYRAVLFTHEMTHLRKDTFRVFRVVWNLLCGIPFLLPSYSYYVHLSHHRREEYGTQRDGEYIPLGSNPPWKIVAYLLQALVIPICALVRFLVLTPIAWFVPSVRRWVDRHASALLMDWTYERPDPTPEERPIWRIQEAACFLVWTLFVSLLILRIQPLSWLVQAYSTGVFIIFLNQIRTAAAHRFVGQGEKMNFTEQLIDSVNVPGRSPLTSLWAPLGLRYHALHHLFPALPYHSLHAAHMRLMEQLPADSPYRSTVRSSLFAAFAHLWRTAHESQRQVIEQTAAE